MIRIQFKHGCELLPFRFPTGWIGEIVLDAAIIDTDEDVYEEGEEDGEHTFYPTLQRSTKVYILKTGLINDSQLKTLYYLPLFDSVAITLETGERLNMQHIQVEHEYPFDNKYQAVATMRFDVGEVMTKTTCCKNMSTGTVTKAMGTAQFTCEISGGAYTRYERAMVLAVETYLDGEYQGRTLYSVLDAFESYAALTEMELAALAPVSYNARIEDFIDYVKDLEDASEGVIRRRYNPHCRGVVIGDKCLTVIITRSGGTGIGGTLKVKRNQDPDPTMDVAVSTSAMEFAHTYEDVGDDAFNVVSSSLNVTGATNCVRTWSLDGVHYWAGSGTDILVAGVICTKVWFHLNATSR